MSSPKRADVPIVLVFGESENDRGSIKALIEALCPAMAGCVQTRRKPLVLLRKVRPELARTNATKIAAVVRADAVQRPVLCVFAHEDCDEVEPAHVEATRKIEAELGAAGVRNAHAATPAWELEAWWFLFPDAIPAVHPRWRKPIDFVGKSVGAVRNAKERFARAVRVPGSKSPEYRESDSVAIAEAIKRLGLARKPQGKSASFEAFAARVDRCCAGRS